MALAPADLSIAPGSLTALIGHNGSGKSTLLKMAAGLLDATDGIGHHLRLSGRAPTRPGPRSATSGDDPILYDDLSVREHVDYLMPLHGMDDWAERADDVIARLGLEPGIDDLPAASAAGCGRRRRSRSGFIRPFRGAADRRAVRRPRPDRPSRPARA